MIMADLISVLGALEVDEGGGNKTNQGQRVAFLFGFWGFYNKKTKTAGFFLLITFEAKGLLLRRRGGGTFRKKWRDTKICREGQ